MNNYCNSSDIGNPKCGCGSLGGCRQCIQPTPPTPMPVPPMPPVIGITVGNTVTGAPGTGASVVNRGTPQNVILDFVIPQGVAGPAGQSAIQAYGGVYSVGAGTLALTADTPTAVPLNSVMSQMGTTSSGGNITVENGGVYAIEYKIRAMSANTSLLTAEMTVNGVAVTGGTSVMNATEGTQVDLGVRLITALNANSTVALRITSSDVNTLTLADGTNAYLTVEKIG